MSKYRPKPRDQHGARKGTMAAAVNRIISGRWQSIEDIQRRIKAPKKAVARRLYHGVEKGLYEYEKVIRFKLKRKTK